MVVWSDMMDGSVSACMANGVTTALDEDKVEFLKL